MDVLRDVSWWPWRYRYQAVIVGLESGNRQSLDLLQWRRERDAAAWCDQMNAKGDDLGLTRWEYEPIRQP